MSWNNSYSQRATDQRAYNEWLDLCKRIEDTTALGTNESDEQKEARKDKLKSDFSAFCKYYFPDFIDSDFGWFHKKAAKEIQENKDLTIVLEWAREHAKSIFADVFVPLWLYAKGEVSGMVVVSNTYDKAKTLLGDIQAQFVANLRFINDYGELAKMGDWQEGNFTTTEGAGFWAFGRGQSPRGIRKGAKRPNYCVIDDIDDDEIVHNEVRVDKALDWVLKSLYPALPLHGKRVVWAGNRIHRKSILAKYVGDYEPGAPKREGIHHIKVYAVENPKTHGKADFINGRPAWKERYTLEQLKKRASEIGTLNFNAEYQHEHLVKGRNFKPEWRHWYKTPPLSHFDYFIVYGDSSLGSAKTSDFKSVTFLGLLNPRYKHPYTFHVLDVFCRQTTNNELVRYYFDLYKTYEGTPQYMIEANKLQKHAAWKLLKQDFEAEEQKRGFIFPIRPDERDKVKKEVRIESLIAVFERGLVSWAAEKRGSHDFETAWEQFLAYPEGHDDAPDSFEGAYYYANRKISKGNFKPRRGSYKNDSDRAW
jgi:hypothetical protein